MKNNETISGIILLGIIIILVVLFTRDSKPKVDDSQFRNTFVTSCVDGGSTFTRCDCAFTKLEDKLGLDGVLDMAVKYNQTGVIPTDIYGAVTECINK